MEKRRSVTSVTSRFGRGAKVNVENNNNWRRQTVI
jgi:hypothetical protein